MISGFIAALLQLHPPAWLPSSDDGDRQQNDKKSAISLGRYATRLVWTAREKALAKKPTVPPQPEEIVAMPFAPEILSLDLEPISYIAAVEYGWSLGKTDEIELEYRAFLQAIYDRPQRRLAPSRECDRYWHMHLLDTQRYWDDCMRIFGRFIHHFPYSGVRGEKDHQLQHRRFLRSQRLIGQLKAELIASGFTHPTETYHEAA